MQTTDEAIETDMDAGTETRHTVAGDIGLCHKDSESPDNSAAVLNDVPVCDPYELSKHSDNSGQDANSKPPRKFNTLIFVIISAVCCILLCKSCDRFITHPSEFVLGSPPGAFVDKRELQIQNERMKYDVDLFYECLNNIILGREPDKQVERFTNNRYVALKDCDRKCVALLKIFTEAQKEYVKLFVEYGEAWNNSGELAIYGVTWDRENDKRGWDDLVNEAEAAVNALTKGVSEHKRKYFAKIETIIGMRNKEWLKNVCDTYMVGFDSSKIISIRSDGVNTLKSLVELYGQTDEVEEKDGKLVFKDDALAEKEKKAWQAIDKSEKEMIKLIEDVRAVIKQVEDTRAKAKQ